MFHGNRIVVVMPAYNAALTIERTTREIPMDLVDEIVVTDDASRDDTVEVARRLGLRTLVHDRNRGYGGNQKTCYTEALRLGADIVVMLHPDYQYTPKLLPAMIGLRDRRPLRRRARLARARRPRAGGRHAGLQVRRQSTPDRRRRTCCAGRSSPSTTPATAPSRARCSSRCRCSRTRTTSSSTTRCWRRSCWPGFEIGEMSCPAAYFEEASSINFRRSVRYGLGVLGTSLQAFAHRKGLASVRIFDPNGRRLDPSTPPSGASLASESGALA